MKKIDETIVTMTTENNHLGGMTMKNNLNTANDVLPEHAAEPEDYRVDGILYCGKCRTSKEILVPEEQAGSLACAAILLACAVHAVGRSWRKKMRAHKSWRTGRKWSS